MIEVKNLKKNYGEVEALKGISFKIEKGEIIGFLGPNGAGKTTCMKILTGFLAPTDGFVKIDKYDISNEEEALKSREKIGYLPENAPLYYDMVVYEYLKYISEIRKMSKQEFEKRIVEVAKMCGIVDVLGKYIQELSKGYRQRVALAQAMIHNPEILILDEPTSGLDPNQIIEIRNLIKELGKERTVILSTHNLPEVVQTCGRIIIIHKGKIVADGTPEGLEKQVKAKPRLNVKFKKNGSAKELEGELKSLPGVHAVIPKIDTEKEAISFEIEMDSEKDVREVIFNFAKEKNITLLEMWRDVMNLEKLFSQLTRE